MPKPRFVNTPGFNVSWNWNPDFKRLMEDVFSVLGVKLVHVNSLYRTKNANSHHRTGRALDLDRVYLWNGKIIDFHWKDTQYNKEDEFDFYKRLKASLRHFKIGLYGPSWLYTTGGIDRANTLKESLDLDWEHRNHLHIGVDNPEKYTGGLIHSSSLFVPGILILSGGIYYYVKNKDKNKRQPNTGRK